MQTANEYLSAILQVVGRIEQNQRNAKQKDSAGKLSENASGPKSFTGSISSQLGSAISSFSSVKKAGFKNFFYFIDEMINLSSKAKDKNIKKMEIISDSLKSMGASLPSLASGLDDLGKIRTERVERAIHGLKLLYDFMEEAGESRKTRKIDRAVKTFDKIGKSLSNIAKPIKTITMGFAYLGLGILAFAGSLFLTAMILKLSSPQDVILFLGATVIGVALMFGILALASKVVDKGSDVIKDIGIGMVALSLGIISFALTIRVLPKILGGESGGSIAKSMLFMLGIVGAAVLMFALIGSLDGLIKRGVGVVFLMSLGMLVLGVAIVGLATAAKYLMGGSLTLGEQKAGKEEKDDNKRMILKGLGVMGLVILGSVALFVLLGLASSFILPGVAISLGMSLALIVMAKSIIVLSDTAKKLAGVDIAGQISFLIKGAIEGFLNGISALSGGKKGISGIKEFIKNSAKVFAGVGVLMSMSLALSMFAKAISAFAELENMRVINGYEENGKPIFGEKVNIRSVAQNINFSISTFLEALLSSTEGLTKDKAKALKKMGRALTGRRGILGAVIQFADVLKTFAQFGPEGKIGYVDFIPDGVDEDGNAKFKQVPNTVSIQQVSKNIANSFGSFVDEMVKHTSMFEITGSKGRSMMRLAEVLMGSKALKVFGLSFGKEKPGLLQPITKFSEIINQYAQISADGKTLPLLDDQGKIIKKVNVSTVANGILSALGVFTEALSADKLKTDTKKAEKNIGNFSDLMEKVNKVSSSLDSLEKFNMVIKDLALNIGSLSENMAKLNTDKLSDLAKSSYLYNTNAYSDVNTNKGSSPVSVSKSNDYSVTNKKIQEGSYKSSPSNYQQSNIETTPVNNSSKTAGTTSSKKESETNWEMIASQIGDAVGMQIMGAIKSGQIKFEFAPGANNKGVIEFS